MDILHQLLLVLRQSANSELTYPKLLQKVAIRLGLEIEVAIPVVVQALGNGLYLGHITRHGNIFRANSEDRPYLPRCYGSINLVTEPSLYNVKFVQEDVSDTNSENKSNASNSGFQVDEIITIYHNDNFNNSDDENEDHNQNDNSSEIDLEFDSRGR